MPSCRNTWRFRLWFEFWEKIRIITYTAPAARNADIKEICGKSLSEVEKDIEKELDLLCPPEDGD